MSFDWWTFGLQTVNFAILVWLLHRFLYKPVLRMVDARRAEIDRDRVAAREAQAAAAEERDRIRADRERIETDRTALLAAARGEAETAAAARREQAERDAAELVEQARASLTSERAAAAGALRTTAFDLGLDIARRLLAEIPVELRSEAWLHRVEAHLAAMPSEERALLMGGEAEAPSLRVVGAIDFPDASKEQWRQRLAAVIDGDLPRIAFAHDPDLVAGVELQFPGAVLHFSWHSALDSIRSEIAPDADAR